MDTAEHSHHSAWFIRLKPLLWAGALSLLTIVTLLPEESEARRSSFSRSRSSSSRSRSSSRRSSRSSWGSSRSSYRSKGGSFSGGYRSSSSLGKKRPSKSAKRSSSSASRSTSSRSSARRSSPSRSYSKGYGRSETRYRQRRSRYRSRYGDSWWDRPSSWKSRWRSNSRYRYRFRDRYYGRSYYSVGIWDLYFLSHATDLFWYHHWRDPAIQRALYQDRVLQDAELARLESRVHALEGQNIDRDPDYLPDDIGPQDAYSEEYLREIRNEEGSGMGFVLLLSIFGGVLFGYVFFIRKY